MGKKKGRRTTVPGIIALGNGSYRVRARAIDPRTGKMVERDRVIHGANLKQATKEKADLIAEIRGEKEVVERRTLRDYATSWLRGQWNSLCPASRDRYVVALDNHILPALGDLYLDAIRVEAIESWRDGLRKAGLASATVNGHLRVLRAVLARAVRTEGLRFNPASEVKVLPEDDRRITDEEPNALEPEELKRFLNVARENHPQHYPMILMLFTTGARMSAVRALRWDDVDPEKGIIIIRRRVSGKELIPGVKRSRTSRDIVPLHPELWIALQSHRGTFNDDQKRSGLVFPSEAGGLRSGSVLTKPFEDILAVVQIEKRFTPHGCR